MRADVRSPQTILEKYTVLLDLSLRMNSERNFDQLLKLIADEATKHVDADRATIFILDKNKGSMRLTSEIGRGSTFTVRLAAIAPQV